MAFEEVGLGHRVILEGRKKLAVSGVEEVEGRGPGGGHPAGPGSGGAVRPVPGPAGPCPAQAFGRMPGSAVLAGGDGGPFSLCPDCRTGKGAALPGRSTPLGRVGILSLCQPAFPATGGHFPGFYGENAGVLPLAPAPSLATFQKNSKKHKKSLSFLGAMV